MTKQRERRRYARVFHPGDEDAPIRFELFSNERFEQHAESLAKAQVVSKFKTGRKLMPRVHENARVLFEAYEAVVSTVHEQHAITPAAEWLLDNFHVIKEQVSDIDSDLSEKYYQELPKLAEGVLAGFPRIYGIVWALVAHTDSRFAPELLTIFIKAYQKIEPLTIGELWAIPVTLRILLVENLRRMAVLVMRSQTGRRLADEFLNQFEQNATENDKSETTLPNGILPDASLRQAYAVQIQQRLQEPHPVGSPSLNFLNSWLTEQGVSFDELVHREHVSQIAGNATVRNIITSMRAISAFEWPQFVEEVSLVDQCLRKHDQYHAMDFLTRDRYRHAIEDLAKRSPHSELTITAKVIENIEQQTNPSDGNERQSDPGYYLIGAGRYAFEKAVRYKPSLKKRILRIFIAHAGLAYFFTLTLLTFLLLAIPFNASVTAGVNELAVLLIGLFFLFPASDLAIDLVNRLIVGNLPPRHLPRLDFKDGIPNAFNTFVVVPTLFFNEDSVIKQINQMEIRYLSNPSANVYFALLSDWTDADQETMLNDENLIKVASFAIDKLNIKYGAKLFYNFHRKRLWNPTENKWMGWERKRGKLHEFNRLLRGAPDTSFISVQGVDVFVPPNINYVITLDADTKMPMGVVGQLVGIAAHPLNRPVFDPATQCVVDGYCILQPRMTATLPLQPDRSMFHQLFAGVSGTDSYASSASELYQDLFQLGTYSGKGLYHVDTFEAALSGRVPDNTQLSHDLFESVYARCALVNDIEFFDDYPSHTEVAESREHRWARGDWQLIPWIFGQAGKGMPMIGRWKMLDNLRRSLSAPGAFFALITIWSIPNAPLLALMGFVMTPLILPAVMAILKGIGSPKRGILFSSHLRAWVENVLWAIASSLVNIILLAQHAWLMIDAIVITLIRVLITRKQLLNWVTALQATTSSKNAIIHLFVPLWHSSASVICAAAIIFIFNPAGIVSAAPFLLLWWLAPFVSWLVSLPPNVDFSESLQAQDSPRLRQFGRRIWYFFTTFVTVEENFLPPDNFQETPEPVIAHRSSPTNFGLYLLSVVTARDFGWLGQMETIERIDLTLSTLHRLPRLNGHFYNWYDTRNLEILLPGYISTVDSGNLAGHLLTLSEACQEMLTLPLNLANALAGLRDTHQLFMASVNNIIEDRRTFTVSLRELRQHGLLFGELLNQEPMTPNAWSNLWKKLTIQAEMLVDLKSAYALERGDVKDCEAIIWAKLLQDDIRSHNRDVNNLIPWIHFFDGFSLSNSENPEQTQLSVLINQLSLETPLIDLPDIYTRIINDLNMLPQDSLGSNDKTSLIASLQRALGCATSLSLQIEKMVRQINALFHEMNFSFLFDTDRQLFSLGFNVNNGTIDPSYYDLLASEARLASFIAIAKREIPVTHWFHLGRKLTRAAHGAVLLSWSGSMFEYLMPSLIMYTPRYSLLDQTCRLAVKKQIEYGKECGIPWGVSESAYDSRDHFFTYQYSAFGVPGLGMKRGLGAERVIAPYATALAAMYLPHDAVKNFGSLEKIGALGRFGFYEALDYTPVRLAEGQTWALVRCYMAHHQGMSLIGFNNAINDGVMRHRFHKSPIIQAADLLLQERIPIGADSQPLPLLEILNETKETVQPPVRRSPLPTSSIPSTHLLSNGRYTVLITAAGSGYSQWQNLLVSRWREDPVRDPWGSYIYLRDVSTNRLWSAGYQPTVIAPDEYQVVFSEDRARITRTNDSIVSVLEVIISPEDDAEIRRLSLTNKSLHTKEIEITSYAEIVLAPLAADIAHPAFSNLFVQTEYIPQIHGLMAHRRIHSTSVPQIWAAHILAMSHLGDSIQYETDRARFIGRGETLREPIAVRDGRPLSNTVGAVLDPIFSLRTTIRIASGETKHLTFTTLVSSSRQAVIETAEKYQNISTFDRVSSLSWTLAHVQLHHLRIKPNETQLFQDLANHLIYIDPTLHAGSKTMQTSTLSVSALWRHGISGDRPILLLRVTEPEDQYLIRQLLRAHKYWQLKGLSVDLIILNEKQSTYIEDLQHLLTSLVQESQSLSSDYRYENQGAIFILRADQLTIEERQQLLTVARAVLISNRGTLAEQLLRHPRPASAYVSNSIKLTKRENAEALIIPDLELFNGLGGFANNGSEYLIVLDNGQHTPAPWVNIIANPEFGFMVSESGSGCTWSQNSHENLLTPWANDAVIDPSGEVIYIRDDETNELWTPTALPIRVENSRYIIRHGQGYSCFEHASHGIYSKLIQFVSPDDPVKISSLTLKNNSGRTRRLTITAYVEWVLGASRRVTAAHVITEQDEETGALLAYNGWDIEFGNRIAFADLVGLQTGYTCNRAEFIGRNGSLDSPSSLFSSKPLKKRTGAGIDPCTALQTAINLEPNAEIEIIFLLGQGDNRSHTKQLIQRYRNSTTTTILDKAKQSWHTVLKKVQVKTPDRQFDLLLNNWLLYQTLSCRMWARAGFYQVGGAFGFRDQLQDSMALTVTRPDFARAHILLAAAHQFPEGDVQHWWHPPSGRGVRTHFSDDRIWLPFVVAHYIKVCGDIKILDEQIPFIEGVTLEIEQDDAYFEPTESKQSVSLYEHCIRALEISLKTGTHGLPLIGTGDWNDGMNRVGSEGKGESIWLAWFLMTTLGEFAKVADDRGETDQALRWRAHIDLLKAAVESEGWDGTWYRRAYFDDGSPLGSASNAECRIDSIAQSWAVISGYGDPERAQIAMSSVRDYLVRYGDDIVLLFTPPFDKSPKDPGYIKSYPPGIRENGGQYTHAAIWSAIAFTKLGDGDQAMTLLQMMNPINRTASRTGVSAYKVEPYVLAADIYSEPPHTRRGGWTWYTGAAGWYYRAGLESILGLQVRADKLFFDPCIPKTWRKYSIIYQHQNTRYDISVENPDGVSKNVIRVELNGDLQLNKSSILLRDDGNTHQVKIVLGHS